MSDGNDSGGSADLLARLEQLEMLVKKVTEENVLLRSAVVGLGTRLDTIEAAPPAARRGPSTPSRPRTAAGGSRNHTPAKYGTLPRNTRPATDASPASRRTPSSVSRSQSSASMASQSSAGGADPVTPARRPPRASPSSSSIRSSSSHRSRTPLSRSTFVHERQGSETPSDDGVDPARKGSYSVGNRKIHYTLPEGVEKPADDAKAAEPPAALELSYAFGFNGSARGNVAYANDGSGRVIYHVAGVGVVMDPATREQRHFLAHNEDILCLAQHPTEPLVATAQLDPKGAGTPYICVWNYQTLEEVARITHHDRGICAVTFSPGGRFIASVGMDDSRTLAVHDWRAHKEGRDPLVDQMSSKDQVFCARFRPAPETGDDGTLTLVVLGVKLVKVFTMEGLATGDKAKRKVTARAPSSFGKTKVVQRAFHSVAFRADGSFVAGTQSGHLYEYGPDSTFRRAVEAHGSSVVGAVAEAPGAGFISVGDDGHVRRWSDELKEEGDAVALPEGSGNARAVAVEAASGRLAVGTKNGTLLQLDGADATTLMRGHTGEVWALAAHPTRPLVATGAHDRTLRVWNTSTNTPALGFTHKFAGSKDSYVRSAAFSADGETLAVGLWSGEVVAFKFGESSLEQLWSKKVAPETVDAVSFSPDGKFVAAGSWDQLVHILVAADGAERRPLRGHTSSVLMLNWSADSKHMMTNSRDYEVLNWEVHTGTRLRRSEAADIEWDGWNCFLGWPVQGIWEDCGDGTDINSVARASKSNLLAAGDDFGLVRLYQWPVQTKHQPRKEFLGHSSHVTNVRWSPDESLLFSAGGADTAVLVWRKVE